MGNEKEKKKNKNLLNLEVVVGGTSVVTYFVLIFLACYKVKEMLYRTVVFFSAAAIFFAGVFSCLKIEQKAGYYKCPNCGSRYVPSMKAVVLAPHFGRSRKMRCPYCGKRGYHKKVLTKN